MMENKGSTQSFGAQQIALTGDNQLAERCSFKYENEIVEACSSGDIKLVQQILRTKARSK